jgi:hypothetical protein
LQLLRGSRQRPSLCDRNKCTDIIEIQVFHQQFLLFSRTPLRSPADSSMPFISAELTAVLQ